MKTNILSLLILIALMGFKNHSTEIQTSASDLVGTWFNEEKTVKVRVFLASNNKYSGKVEWLKEPNDEYGKPKKDPLNPDKSLRDRDRLGMVILKYFVYNEKEKRWEGGTIYDPKNGKTYSGYITMPSANTMDLRGYVAGMTWLGRTATWTRVP